MSITSVLFIGPGFLVSIDDETVPRERSRGHLVRGCRCLATLDGNRPQPGQNRRISQESPSSAIGFRVRTGEFPFPAPSYRVGRRSCLELLVWTVSGRNRGGAGMSNVLGTVPTRPRGNGNCPKAPSPWKWTSRRARFAACSTPPRDQDPQAGWRKPWPASASVWQLPWKKPSDRRSAKSPRFARQARGSPELEKLNRSPRLVRDYLQFSRKRRPHRSARVHHPDKPPKSCPATPDRPIRGNRNRQPREKCRHQPRNAAKTLARKTNDPNRRAKQMHMQAEKICPYGRTRVSRRLPPP